MRQHRSGGADASAKQDLIVRPPGFVGHQFTLSGAIHVTWNSLADIDDPKALATVNIVLRTRIQTRRHSHVPCRAVTAGKTNEVGVCPAPLDMTAIPGWLGQSANLAELPA